MMAGRIPDETLEAIRDRVSIVEVVSGYVSLKKTGRNFTGLCPFHSEKTPSFTVSDERGLFHCFGCGAGGTVFTFVMRIENCEFPQAVEMLARKVGVALPERARGGSDDIRQALFRLNEAAQRRFVQALQGEEGAAARTYLAKRGLQPATIEKYGLGYCPRGGTGFSAAVASKPAAVDAAFKLGLLGRREDGSTYEKFWNRVTFPIRDGGGRILGFGGRTLGDNQPKYLNSPDSALFHKGRVLYGLFEARQAVRDAERLVIVEGYMDALALVEAGIGCVVASLGTALTVDHLRLARRFAPEIVAFFDGDRAGLQAAERAFEVCLDAGIWGLGAFLPEGLDPDDYVRREGVAVTNKLLAEAKPLAEFFLDRVDPGPNASVPERIRAAQRVARAIVRVEDPVMFDLLAKESARRLGVDESIFRDQRKVSPTQAAPLRPDDGAEEAPVAEDFRPEEITLVAVMSLDRTIAEQVASSAVLGRFENSTLAQVGDSLLSAWRRDGDCQAAIDTLPPSVAARLAAAQLGDEALAANRKQIAGDCVRKIEARAQRAQTKAAVSRVREVEAGGDAAEVREALEQTDSVLRQREVGHE
jgi:DNA primase